MELAESLERYRAILDTAVDGIITISDRGLIESFNRAAERIFGYRAIEVIGRNVSLLMPEPDRSAHDGYLANYLRSGQAKIIGLGREVRGLRKDGTTFPLELSVGEVHLASRRMFTGITRDISDRKALEADTLQRLQELAHANRLAAMGEMATTLAHEVNQPLTATVMHAGVCLRLLDEPGNLELVKDSLQQISRQGQRAGEVIRRLRQYVRKEDAEFRPGNLNEIVSDVRYLIGHEAQRIGVVMELELDDTLPEVAMDSVQIEQVVFNVTRNALEALATLEDGLPRRLCLRTAQRQTGGAGVVEFVAADSGPGFGATDPNGLFEPHYTTKAQGMGLGLSICRSIIEAHQGRIWAESVAPRGACFRFQLPIPGPEGASA